MTENDGEDIFEEEGRGRGKRKREAEALKELGAELVRLPESDLAALPLEEKLRDAIELARRIKAHGGAARQRQLIGKILRHSDVAIIRSAIERRQLDVRLQAREFHRIETWRDRLLSEGEPALAAMLAAEPGLDAGHLRRLVDTARHEAALGRPPAAARELFRWLREALAAGGANP